MPASTVIGSLNSPHRRQTQLLRGNPALRVEGVGVQEGNARSHRRVIPGSTDLSRGSEHSGRGYGIQELSALIPTGPVRVGIGSGEILAPVSSMIACVDSEVGFINKEVIVELCIVCVSFLKDGNTLQSQPPGFPNRLFHPLVIQVGDPEVDVVVE